MIEVPQQQKVCQPTITKQKNFIFPDYRIHCIVVVMKTA